MKIIHVADTHFGNYMQATINGINCRSLDFLKNFDTLIDYAIAQKVDVILHCGDVYKNRYPGIFERIEFAKRVQRILQNNIYFIIILGNHDISGLVSEEYHAFDFTVFNLEKLKIFSSISSITIDELDLAIVGIPWLRKTITLNFVEIEKIYYSLTTKYKILAAHLHVNEAVIGPTDLQLFGERNCVALTNLMQLKFDAICLGHIHKAQVLCENPYIAYSGSLSKVDFGERNEVKGFFVLDFN